LEPNTQVLTTNFAYIPFTQIISARNQRTGMSMEFSKSESHAELEIESQFPVFQLASLCMDKIFDPQLITTVTCLLPLARPLWYLLRIDLVFHSGWIIIHTCFFVKYAGEQHIFVLSTIDFIKLKYYMLWCLIGINLF
jgi:hypothetical protein